MGENEGDGLRMLVLKELCQRLTVHFMQRFDTVSFVNFFGEDAAQNWRGFFRPHRSGDDALEIIARSLGEDVGFFQESAGLFEDFVDMLAFDVRHAMHALAQHDDFFFDQLAGDRRCQFLADQSQKNRRLFWTA